MFFIPLDSGSQPSWRPYVNLEENNILIGDSLGLKLQATDRTTDWILNAFLLTKNAFIDRRSKFFLSLRFNRSLNGQLISLIKSCLCFGLRKQKGAGLNIRNLGAVFRSGDTSPCVGAGAPLFPVRKMATVRRLLRILRSWCRGERTGQTPAQNLEEKTPNYGINNYALFTRWS